MADDHLSRPLGQHGAGIPIVPRGAPVAAALLLGLIIAAAGLARDQGAGAPMPERSAMLASRALVFADRADGGVQVTDATTHGSVAVLSGEQGFLRGTLRALARERRQRAVEATAPFTLTAWADGRLTLDDPATSRRIELSSFGPSNASRFATLLEPSVPLPAPPQRTAAR